MTKQRKIHNPVTGKDYPVREPDTHPKASLWGKSGQDEKHAKLKGYDNVVGWYLACLNAEINILLEPTLRTSDRLLHLASQAKKYIGKIEAQLANKHRLDSELRGLTDFIRGYCEDGCPPSGDCENYQVDAEDNAVDCELCLKSEAEKLIKGLGFALISDEKEIRRRGYEQGYANCIQDKQPTQRK